MGHDVSTRLMVVAALVAGALACGPKNAPPQHPATLAEDAAQLEVPIVYSAPLDDRAYRVLQLDNGLTVLLAQDPDTDMAAAALDVHVGQFQDPPDREGLAHFLEHMLFLGTDAYPDVDAYRSFVQAHGGGTNAGTGQEHTRYHFTIDHRQLEGALDRFAAFFTSPRLDPEYVERERNAVHSEYRLKIQTEARRFREVRRATSNPAHGFAKFSVGNHTTLADREGQPVWDDLRAFYTREYSASRMALSVIGREDLDTLEAWVRSRFDAVPSTGAPPPSSTVPPYLPHQLGVRIHVTPLDEVRRLRLEFPVPPATAHATQHPIGLLTGLIGQEGAGSPHAVLTERGWITALSTSSSGAEDHGLVVVDLQLTESGLTHVDDVAAVIFGYIRLLRQADTLEPWWTEQRQLNTLAFAYAEPARAGGHVRATASALQLHPPSHVLNHWALWDDYDAAVHADHLARLTPEAVRMFVVAPGLDTDQVEPRYDVPWSMTPLSEATKTDWATRPIDPSLALPPDNPFLPGDAPLVDAPDNDAPVAIVEAPGLRVWHLADPSWRVPKAATTVRLTLGALSATLEDVARLKLWTALVTEALAPVLDQARVAGVRVALSRTADGLTISLSGWSDRQDDVLQAILTGMRDLDIDPDTLKVRRDNLVRIARNTRTNRPIDQARWARDRILSPTTLDHFAVADEVETLDTQALEDWRAHLFDSVHAEVLVHGNLTAAQATAIGRIVTTTFEDASPADVPPILVRHIPQGTELRRNLTVEHDDSALRVNYQGTDPSPEAQARWMVLGQLIRTPAFTTLRTEQQLGYIVWSGYARRDHLPGLSVAIQSGREGPEVLLQRVDAFLADFGNQLTSMSEEEFATARAGLVAQLEEAPSSLMAQSSQLVRDLSLGVTTFDRQAHLAKLVASVERNDVVAIFNEHILSDARGRLVVSAVGRSHADLPLPPDGADNDAALHSQMPEQYTRHR